MVYLSEAPERSGGNAGVWPLPSPYLGFRFLCYSDPESGDPPWREHGGQGAQQVAQRFQCFQIRG